MLKYQKSFPPICYLQYWCKIGLENYTTAFNLEKCLVIVEQIGSIKLIGINRPEKRNCINSETAFALQQAFKDFHDDDNAKVAVLFGVGGNFCAGYDMDEISYSDTSPKIQQLRGPIIRLNNVPYKPVIAAVEGYAVGEGFELALLCDLRIIDETAVMGVFSRRWGVPAKDGGSVRLPSIVGLGRALDIIITGRPIRAPEAFEIGLASKMVACGAAIGNAVFYAEGLARHPQEALKSDANIACEKAFFTNSIQKSLQSEQKSGF